MQSDAATCHTLCVPHKEVPGCYTVDGGVIDQGEFSEESTANTIINLPIIGPCCR